MKPNRSRSLFYLSLLLTLVIGCTKNEAPKPEPEVATVMDIDSNVYKTVKIGDKWWMAENLKVTRFRNGIAIPEIHESIDWQAAGPACCYYGNTAGNTGMLYNFHAVSDQNNIAPEGWHVPSDDEWKQLELHLGMSSSDADKANWRGSDQGDKLKIEGPNGWTEYENVWGNNESGFTALAEGCRMFNGNWGDPGLFATGFWWSSTLEGDQAWYRHLDYKKSGVFRYHGPKSYGLSVRCVKD